VGIADLMKPILPSELPKKHREKMIRMFAKGGSKGKLIMDGEEVDIEREIAEQLGEEPMTCRTKNRRKAPKSFQKAKEQRKKKHRRQRK
jgi:hypothetical protein